MKKMICLSFLLFLASSIYLYALPASTSSMDYNNEHAFDVELQNPQFSHERVNTNRAYDWYEYAGSGDITTYFSGYSETATLFHMLDFGLTYPATIEKVEAWFYNDGTWDSSTFRFRIYDVDGTTVLYESEDLTAVHYAAYTYTLTTPLVVNDDFYVSVVTDPNSTNGSPFVLGCNYLSGHSYSGSTRALTPIVGYELIRSVYLEGTTPSDPILAVDPSSYDFGILTPNCTNTKTFTIYNAGGGTLIVDPAPTLTGDPEFGITHSSTYPASVPPSITVDVSFTPTAIGSYATTLSVVSDYGTVNVTIIGDCDLPDISCPIANTIWNQPVINSDGGWQATTSSQSSGYVVYEDFEGLEYQICDIHFWGMNLFYSGGWSECTTSDTFNIKFYDDNAGEPGNLVCEYLNITPLKTPIPNSNITYGYWVYEYSYVFDACCDLSTGWVSIENIESDCWFLWLNSIWGNCEYDGDDMAYQWDGATLTLLDRDLALCLTSECNMSAPQILSAYIEGTDMYITWDADPCANSYKIYAGNDPSAAFTPGGNANWSLVANVSGTSWNGPALDGKKFYLVVGVQ